MKKCVFSSRAFFIHLLIRIILGKFHHHPSGCSDNLPGQKNVLQPERLDLLPASCGRVLTATLEGLFAQFLHIRLFHQAWQKLSGRGGEACVRRVLNPPYRRRPYARAIDNNDTMIGLGITLKRQPDAAGQGRAGRSHSPDIRLAVRHRDGAFSFEHIDIRQQQPEGQHFFG
jgi:hypothetical protein